MNPRRFRKKVQHPARKQPMPETVQEELLRFIQVKFYSGDSVAFSKDRPRLLQWVVYKLATYLEERGVTINPNQYLEIMRDKVLMEAVRHQKGPIEYVPAWLGKTVESHLYHNGEDYYDAAKSVRNAVDNAMAIAHVAPTRAPDPVREFAQAARLLKARKPAPKPPVKQQLTLL